jgi:PHD/YefM family antitoxin component YafN of YafNO toxin-antitoxin module
MKARRFKATRRHSFVQYNDRVRRKRRAIMVLNKEYEGLRETIHLLSNPANAQDLLSAVAEANGGKFIEGELIDE